MAKSKNRRKLKKAFFVESNASLFHLHLDETIDVFGFGKKALVVTKHPQWGVKQATFCHFGTAVEVAKT